MFNIGYEINDDGKIKKRRETVFLGEGDLEKYLKLKVKKFITKNIFISNIKVINRNTLDSFTFDVRDDKLQLVDSANISNDIKKMMNKKDVQQDRVYKWENETFSMYGINESIFNQKKMVSYINFIVNKLNINEIGVNFIGHTNYSSFRFNYELNNDNTSLNFSLRMLNKFVAIHEISHYIVFLKRLNDFGHGKYFLGIYAYLLIRFINVNKDYVYKTLDKSGLSYINYEQAKKIIDNR